MEELYIFKEKKMLKRAFIFWDHANILHNLQELNIRIDYELVKSRLARGYYLVAAVMYLGGPKILYPNNQKLFYTLVKQRWLISEIPLKVHILGNKTHNGIENDMFLDLCDFAMEGAYEKVIIISGDSSFVGIIKELKELGLDIDLWSFRIFISRALINEVGTENMYYFDDFMEEITMIDYSQDIE